MLRRALKFGFYLVATLILLLGMLILTPVLLAQNTNSRYDNILWTSSYVAGQQVLVPIPNAQVQVCSYPANAIPCTNLSTLYYGPTILGGVAPNPTTSDAYGNFGFWAAAGYYQYTITNTQGQSAGPYSISLGGSGAGVNPFSVTPGVVFNTSTSASQNATSAQIVTALNTSPSIQVSAALIPILNQNTTGTAANLSGTPALPNGTTATTQSPGDTTTKLATDAFVIANSPFQSLTTTGSLGAATLTSGVLNIPQYSGGGTPGGSSTQAQFNSSSAFAGSPALTFRTADGSVSQFANVQYLSAGSDIGAQCNTAVTALSGTGVIVLPNSTSIPMSTTCTNIPPGITIKGYGKLASIVNCTVAGDCFQFLMNPTTAGEIGSVVSDFEINGSGASNQVLMHFNGMSGYTLHDLQFEPYAGSGNAAVCLELDNSATGLFTEGNRTYNVSLERQCTIGVLFNQSGSDADVSFGYNIFEFHVVAQNSNWGVVFNGNAQLYGGSLTIYGNHVSNNTGGGMVQFNNGTFTGESSSGAAGEILNIYAEENGSGSGSMIDAEGSGILHFQGVMINGGGGAPTLASNISGSNAANVSVLAAPPQQVTTLAAPATSVTFNVPPGAHNLHLYISASNDTSDADALEIQFNGDTGNNYNSELLYATGSSPGAASIPTATAAFACNTSHTRTGASCIIDIIGYNTALQKSFSSRFSVPLTSSTQESGQSAVTWLSTAAITSIRIVNADGANFVSGSVFTLTAE